MPHVKNYSFIVTTLMVNVRIKCLEEDEEEEQVIFLWRTCEAFLSFQYFYLDDEAKKYKPISIQLMF